MKKFIKVAGTKTGARQEFLQAVRNQEVEITGFILDNNKLIAVTKRNNKIKIGKIKDADIQIARGILAQQDGVAYDITGGYIAIYDENEQEVACVGDYNDIPCYMQHLIGDGWYSCVEKGYGFNLAV